MRPTDALPHPVDWDITTVRRSVDLKRGVSWSKEQEHAGPGIGRVPVIGIGNVQRTLELDDLLYLSGVKPAVVEKKRVTAGWTVLVGSNGNRVRIGNAAKAAVYGLTARQPAGSRHDDRKAQSDGGYPLASPQPAPSVLASSLSAAFRNGGSSASGLKPSAA
jgi:hypothetical protein